MIDINNAQEISFDDNKITIQIPYSMLSTVQRFIINIRKKHNCFFRLRMNTPRKIRTIGEKSQNHHLNGHVQQICIETGNDFESVKDAIKFRAIEMGYPFRTISKIIIPYSEAEADTKECAILIESAHIIASELNITLRETKS